MSLDLILFLTCNVLSFIGGYTLRGHIHGIADKAVQAGKDALSKAADAVK